MKTPFFRIIILSIILVGFVTISVGQNSSESFVNKRERHKNLTIKEFNTDAKGKNQWIDHVTKYNDKGLKIEEIEYASYGMRDRVVYEYDSNDLCTKEIVFDERNKVSRIRKYKYNSNGSKTTQYNYLPNGRLHSTKQYEYSY